MRPRFDDTPRESREEAQVASAAGAFLRGLDQVSGEVTDLDLSVGETVRLGRLSVSLDDCRYPVDDPAGDAYALLTSEADGITGKAVTPFLLARIFTLSGGRSLEANIALVEANARLAARIAVARQG